mgnify:CR=1 FL=1
MTSLKSCALTRRYRTRGRSQVVRGGGGRDRGRGDVVHGHLDQLGTSAQKLWCGCAL